MTGAQAGGYGSIDNHVHGPETIAIQARRFTEAVGAFKDDLEKVLYLGLAGKGRRSGLCHK
jgi:hypothetical protein